MEFLNFGLSDKINCPPGVPGVFISIRWYITWNEMTVLTWIIEAYVRLMTKWKKLTVKWLNYQIVGEELNLIEFVNFGFSDKFRAQLWRSKYRHNFHVFQPILLKFCKGVYFFPRIQQNEHERAATNLGQRPNWGWWPVIPPYIWYIRIFQNFAKRPIKISWPVFLLLQTSCMRLGKRIYHLSLF